MYLRQLQLKRFRAISELTVNFHRGLNVIIGENNTGKTAVLDAFRLCLGLGAERRELYLTRHDFHVNEEGVVANTIEFDLVFRDLSPEERGAFVEMLSVADGRDDELQLHVRYSYDAEKDRVRQRYWGGDNEGQNIPFQVLEQLYFVYLGALRDATRDLAPARRSRISRLLLKLVPDGKDREKLAGEINDSVTSSPSWKALLVSAEGKVNAHLAEVALQDENPAVEIAFVEHAFQGIAESLRVHLPVDSGEAKKGEEEKGYSFELWQNGLGYNNLIYAAAVLGDLFERREKEPTSHISLLMEEPEAHLHPQWQNVFFSYLKKIEAKRIQVFVTSHSPTVTAKTDIDSLIVLRANDKRIKATPLRNVDMSGDQKQFLRRFLDVTKSQMFFAKAILLVEGISEALLLPNFATRMGTQYDLEKNGVEVVSINGVAFEPFALMFNSTTEDKRINVRCSIITDDDRNGPAGNSDGNGDDISSRAAAALNLEKGLVKVCLGTRTLEYELYRANAEVLTRVYQELHPRTNLEFDGSVEQRASAFAAKVAGNKDKAVLAQTLAKKLEEEGFGDFVVPDYIQQAIRWAICGDETTDNAAG
jgi:putative ATP-dependent endonuclease of the OLD family